MSRVPRTGAGGFLHQAPKHQLFGASPGPLAQAGHEVIASDPPRVGGCSCIGSHRWPSSWAPCAVAREWQADEGATAHLGASQLVSHPCEQSTRQAASIRYPFIGHHGARAAWLLLTPSVTSS